MSDVIIAGLLMCGVAGLPIGLAVLLASPCYRHRVHRLFRHRVLVEAGAGHLAHCRNPALHSPRQQVN